jgi:hypothetical protein
MPVFHKRKIDIFMEVTYPRLLDVEGTDIPTKCLLLLATTAYHPTRLESSSTLLSEPETLYFP